jgi:hypothetical protein
MISNAMVEKVRSEGFVRNMSELQNNLEPGPRREFTAEEIIAMDFATWIRNALGPSNPTTGYLAEVLRLEIQDMPLRSAPDGHPTSRDRRTR